MIAVKQFNKNNLKNNAVVNIVMYTRFVLGIYSELSKSIVFAVVARFYCLILIVSVVFIKYRMQTLYPAPIKILITSMHQIVLYSLIALVSMLSNGEHFYDYLNGIDKIDSKLMLKGPKYEFLITLSVFVYIILIYTFCFIYMINIDSFGGLTFYYFAMTSVYTASGLSHLVRIMMFEALWNRMKSLRLMMEKHIDFSQPISNNQVEEYISKLENYLKVYNNLLDNLKCAGHASKLMILFSLPAYFVYVLSFILELVRYGTVISDYIYFIDASTNTLVPLVPAILAELVTVQIEKIKTHLNRQLLVCSHDALRNRTYNALKFLELRPFKYTIWRAFSLNISLPLGLISICTTYTIVVIQFSHVYG